MRRSVILLAGLLGGCTKLVPESEPVYCANIKTMEVVEATRHYDSERITYTDRNGFNRLINDDQWYCTKKGKIEDATTSYYVS